MRALSLNFESKGRGASLGYGMLALGGLMAALMVGAQVTLDQEIGRLARAAPAAVPKRVVSVLPRGVSSEADAIAGARTVVGHLAGPGAKLFVTLEAIEEPDVALLALRPDSRTRILRIDAEARGPDAMLSYLRVLEQSRAFTQVVLVDHEIQDSDPQHPLRFGLAAAWGP